MITTLAAGFEFKDALPDLVGGFTVTAIWAVLILIFNKMRNDHFENVLEGTFENNSFSWSATHGIGTVLHNRTPIPVVIRSVEFISEEGITFELGYKGPHTRGMWEIPREDPPFIFGFGSQSIQGDPERGFQLLNGYCSGIWYLSHQAIEQNVRRIKNWRITTCRVLVEYPTMFGGRRITIVEAHPALARIVSNYLRDIVVEIKARHGISNTPSEINTAGLKGD